MAYHRQLRLWEAEQLYRRALKGDDLHFGALYHLGLLYLQQSKFDDAARLFRRAINVDRNSAEAHHHLAIALIGLGRVEEAIQRYEKALTIRPDLAETHNNLGHALQTLGRIQEAIAHYEKALVIRPAYAEAGNNLGNTLVALGRPEEAIAHYEQALAINPKYAEAYNNLGNALVANERGEQAIVCYERALAIDPNDSRARASLGNTLHLIGRTEEAITHFQLAIAATPGDAQAHNDLGGAFKALGKLAQAIQAFEKEIALAPRRAVGFLNLATSRRFTAEDPYFAAMKQLARDIASLEPEEQIRLHFALGKAFADVGDRRQSFQHLLQGNALKRQQIDYDEAKALTRLKRIQAVFTAELLREKKGLGEPSPVPVFIIGMPRSGTTLIEQILASHPKVFGAGELRELGRLTTSITRLDGSEFPESVPAMSGEQFRQLGENYLRAVGHMAPAAKRITDKMPANFALAGLIHLALPNARLIHVRRDPRDTALSCFSILFTAGQDHTYDLAELGRYYRGYQALMEHWGEVLPEGVMLDVQYEEVVLDLETQARRIVAHCGLEWDDRCLTFYRTERSVRTASATQVRQPIYRNSVGRWRDYEDVMQPFVQALQGR